MGICLETEKKNENEEDVEKSASREAWISQNSRYFGYPNSPDVEERFSMQNNVSVKFEKPKIPVIFVLGGPGSGKITHCDNLSEEKRGVIHINMSDLLQQYSMGSEEKNYNELSSKTITEVLMLEMKMSPAAKAYLVSGYPRNMRDVVEYHDKIQTVNGVLLLAWRKNMLERQVEYGAKLGHIVLQFARMELTNFFQNVTPVADYFDQRNMLIVINGERNPAEVYNDFRAAVMRILSLGTFSSTELEKAGIPNGGIVQPSEETPVISLTTSTKAAASNSSSNVREKSELILEPIPNEESNVEANKLPLEDIPGLVFVIGGPGSNKSELCRKILQRIPGWGHISLGLTLREKVTSGQLTLIEAQSLKDVISSGELVDSQIVYKTLDDEIAKRSQFRGIVIDGFPRNLDQMHIFEEKYNQHPLTLLLDCSKLSMGRNRWDDNIKAFRRRLELFAEQTLPMLKVIDTEHRLNTIDGDTEIPEVQEELAIALIDAIQHVEQDLQLMPNSTKGGKNSSLNVGAAALLQDLDDEEEPLPAKPNATMMNGYGPTRSLAAHNRARFDQIAPNANGPMAGPNVVSVPHAKGSSSNTHRIHAQIESYPMDKIN